MKKELASKEKMNFKDIFKKGDILIIIVLIVAIILTAVFVTKPTSQTAEIYVDGALKYSVDLSRDSDITLLNGEMIISVRGGEIFVAKSDCKEQLCVTSHAISKEGGIIVCLPNKVIIKISSEEVDAIT